MVGSCHLDVRPENWAEPAGAARSLSGWEQLSEPLPVGTMRRHHCGGGVLFLRPLLALDPHPQRGAPAGSAACNVGAGASCPRAAPPGQGKWSAQRPCGFLGRLQRLSLKKKKSF